MDVNSKEHGLKGWMDFDEFIDTFGLNPLDFDEVYGDEILGKKKGREAYNEGRLVSTMEDDEGNTSAVAVGWRLVNVLHRTILPVRVYEKDETGHDDFSDELGAKYQACEHDGLDLWEVCKVHDWEDQMLCPHCGKAVCVKSNNQDVYSKMRALDDQSGELDDLAQGALHRKPR